MEFIQKKTADRAVEHFLLKAADMELSLAWDRFEGQLPECGFCESGLSCRDCLQGPCISHPFRDRSKLGVCGKDRDILAVQSLMRVVVKGVTAYLDQLGDLVEGMKNGGFQAKDAAAADKLVKEAEALMMNGGSELAGSLPKSLTESWKALGVLPEGIVRDLFKASQKIEGGFAGVEETLLWTMKTALLGFFVHELLGRMNKALFGDVSPKAVDVNMGVLSDKAPNLLVYGPVSPMLKARIAEMAKAKGINVFGVCTETMLGDKTFAPVTNYTSQEMPLMTGAVDLIVACDQYVHPSLEKVAKEWNVTLISAGALGAEGNIDAFAKEIVEQTEKAHAIRKEVERDIPNVTESALIGLSSASVDVKKIADAVKSGKIKAVAILSGSGNVKYTQDETLVAAAKAFLENDIFCIADGEAAVTLAKHGFLNPSLRETFCGGNLLGVLSDLGENIPAVPDICVTDFVTALAGCEGASLKDFPVVTFFR